MLQIERTGRHVFEEGTNINYDVIGTDFVIQSRKRHIPHADRPGTWDHTTYWLVDPFKAWEKEFATLKDAKEFAEKLIGGGE